MEAFTFRNCIGKTSIERPKAVLSTVYVKWGS
jgi:hypothetical protein